jgi:hypothetical protein
MGLDLGKILGSVAPILTSALPGPFGAIAKGIIGGVFGIGNDEEDADKKIAEAVAKATPEQIAAIKAADNDFKVRMAELGFKNVEELRRLEVADMGSARQREVELAKAGKRDLAPIFLAIGACLSFIVTLVYILMSNIDTWGQVKVGIVGGLLGTQGTIVIMVFSYYFGSSHGSAAKNALVDKLTTKPK